MTWVVIWAAIFHIIGDLLALMSLYGQYQPGQISLAMFLANAVRAISYSTLFFGTAAMVEFLFRIWKELRLRNSLPTA